MTEEEEEQWSRKEEVQEEGPLGTEIGSFILERAPSST